MLKRLAATLLLDIQSQPQFGKILVYYHWNTYFILYNPISSNQVISRSNISFNKRTLLICL
jgi:hypothetical protein